MSGELKPYPAYKNSGVPWLCEVPAHWDISRNKLHFMLRRETVGNRHTDYKLLSLTLQGIIPRDMENAKGKFPSDFGTYQAVHPNDFVFCLFDIDETPRTVAVSPLHGMITGAYTVFRPRTINSRYLYYLYLSLDDRKALKPLYTGLRKVIPEDQFLRAKSPQPPPDEQAAIVRYLDYVDRRIRRYIRAKERLVELLNEQKQAIIHQAVTRGLDPDVPLKPSGVEWLGDVPAHWEVMAAKRILRQLIDCEHKTAPVVEKSPYLVVRTSAIRDGKLQLAGTYNTTEEGFAEWTRRGIPQPGDVMFTREAPAGEACVVPNSYKLCLGQRTVLLKLRESQYDANFLVYMIYGGPPAVRIQLASQGSTVGHFNIDDIAAMQVLVPPVDEQRIIVSHLESVTSESDRAIDQARMEVDLIREYRTRLIADVVTGKLDVREAAARLPDEVDDEEPDANADAEKEKLLMHETPAGITDDGRHES